MNNEFTRKIGKNRGKARLWIEGKALAGFQPGCQFDLVTDDATQSLTLQLSDTGPRKVSGKDKDGEAKGIVDINASEQLAVFKDAQEVKLTVTKGKIVITKA